MPTPPEVVRKIVADKIRGDSLGLLATRYSLSKGTISAFVRDFFDHPSQVYVSFSAIQKARYETARVNKARYRAEGRILSHGRPRDYRKERGVPCPKCNGLMKRGSAQCLACRRQEWFARPRALQVSREQRKVERAAEWMLRHPAKASECSSSPNQRHHWLLDSTNNGVCKYCLGERRFAAEIAASSKSR